MNQLPKITGRLLLVGWDAADWKIISPLLDRGEMPNLERLVGRGVMGDIHTLRPVLSPMLWNSIATGHLPERHGILGFGEVDDETRTVRGVTSTSRKCKALWNIVTQAGGRAHAVNWYASHPAEPIAGICVSDMLSMQLEGKLPDESLHPAELTGEFAKLRVRPAEIGVETLRLFVPGWAEVDQASDKNLAHLAKLLAESCTVHNAATRVLVDEPWNFAAIYYPGIDHFSHGFMNFHPPKLPQVSDRKFELYSDVVRGAYRLHDLFLGRLLALAGPGTSVMLVSDHGFHSDHLRPRSVSKLDPVGAAIQHREHGILVIAGAGIKHDERVYGAGLLDVAPTALAMLGLPIGRDMPGRVLVDAFVAPPTIAVIPRWDSLPGDAGQHSPDHRPASTDYGLVLEQFAALGYLDLEEMQGASGVEACQRENDWNLAQSLLDQGHLERGVDLLIELCTRWPERTEFAIVLAQTLQRLGQKDSARTLIEAMVATDPTIPEARLLLGMLALEERCFDDAIAHLELAEATFADRADLHQQKGVAFLRSGRRIAAEDCFERAVDVDPHDPIGWIGLARCSMRRRDWNLAEEHALRAIRLDFNRPWAHAILGAARLRIGRRDDARLALRLACRLAPNWAYPQRLLDTMAGGAADVDPNVRNELKVTLSRLGTARKRNESFLSRERREALSALIAQCKQQSRRYSAASSDDQREPLDLVLVSGLPRSGTSLMMQMLKAGGAELLTDDKRAADVDNPLGYLEWQAIKQLPTKPEVLRAAAGKAVKIVSPLLHYLPRRHQYRVIFLDRPVEEVVQSQLKLRGRSGGETPPADRLREALTQHREASLSMLRRAPNVSTLVVPYPDLVANPASWSNRVAEFLEDRAPDALQMAKAVRPDLYRNKST